MYLRGLGGVEEEGIGVGGALLLGHPLGKPFNLAIQLVSLSSRLHVHMSMRLTMLLGLHVNPVLGLPASRHGDLGIVQIAHACR